MTDQQWKQIFAALSKDIADRRGLKWEWTKIDREVMKDEISPAWRKIIEVVLMPETRTAAEIQSALKIVSEIMRIMAEYRRQEEENGDISTPGGLEHMGDVWRLLRKWDEQARNVPSEAA